MVETEQVVQWLIEGGHEEAATVLAQCTLIYEWVDLLFEMDGNREYSLLDVKIEAPARVIGGKDSALVPEFALIEEAIRDCLKTLDGVVRTIDWVPKLSTSRSSSVSSSSDVRHRELLESLDGLFGAWKHLGSFSGFLQSEGDEEWYVADQQYVQELRAWASTVESALRVSGAVNYLDAWLVATKADISVGNVHDCAERLRILLTQIRSGVARECGSGLDMADVAHTPFLSDKDVADAIRMSGLYTILHCFENSVRRLVENTLSAEYGQEWWQKVASESMMRSVESRRKTEQERRWLSPRGHTSPLYYLEWGDLVKLIRKEEGLFLTRIGTLKFVENRFEELEAVRNIVAHNGTLPSDTDFQRVSIWFRDWCRQVGG